MTVPGQSLLKNHYWFLRHGRSIPNESGLIVSSLSNGLSPGYGLAPSGTIQATLAGELFLENFQDSCIPAENIKLYSSPFSRTRQTAEAVTAVLMQHKLHPTIEVSQTISPEACFIRYSPQFGLRVLEVSLIQFLEDLRERFFGPPLELQSHDHYPEIWKIDARDPLVGPEGGESCADVAMRVIRALLRIEEEVQGHAVIIVSHGDTLQILQTVIAYALGKAVTETDSLLSRLEAHHEVWRGKGAEPLTVDDSWKPVIAAEFSDATFVPIEKEGEGGLRDKQSLAKSRVPEKGSLI